MRKDYDLFTKVLSKIRDGMSITFTKDNVADCDRFLLLGCGYDSCTVTFKRPSDLWWICFDNDEPMLLEDAPDSFYRSILKNLE